MSSATNPAGSSETEADQQPLPGQTSIYDFLTIAGASPCSD